MPHLTKSPLLSLLTVTLSAGCYFAAVFFQERYARANGIVSRAMRQAKANGDLSGQTLVGLPSPDLYSMAANVTVLLAIIVWFWAAVLVVKRRRWTDWVAVVLATAVVFIIPTYVLWMS